MVNSLILIGMLTGMIMLFLVFLILLLVWVFQPARQHVHGEVQVKRSDNSGNYKRNGIREDIKSDLHEIKNQINGD